jgi:hypothetical protein
MDWPKDIIDSFVRGTRISPLPGHTPESVIRSMLDQTANHAAWRVQKHHCSLPTAFTSPYTPLGHASMNAVRGKIQSMELLPEWNDAVDALYEYVRGNAKEILSAHETSAEEYPDDF